MNKILISLFVALVLASNFAGAAGTPKVIDVKVSGHGKPVILIPGLACDGSVWNDTVKKLSSQYQCHVVSVAGFGTTSPVKTDDLFNAARDQIIAYAEAAKLNQPVLIGHSLGGTLAIAIAEKAPDLPSEVISVDGLPFLAGVMMPGVTNAAEARKAADAMGQQIAQESPEQFAQYQKNVSIPSMVTNPKDAAKIAQMCGKSDPATVGHAMRELLSADFRPELGQLKCPILVMGALGGLLQYAPRETLVHNYQSQFTNAPQTRFEFFDHAKHFIMFDDPARFQQIVEKELASPGATR